LNIFSKYRNYSHIGNIERLFLNFEDVPEIKSIHLDDGPEPDATHSPNENYPLEHFYKGIETISRFDQYFAKEIQK